MIFAVVPVKSLERAKSRLGSALSAPERARLVETLLRRVLRALAESGAIAQSAVVSPDPRALAIATAAGAAALPQTGDGLNEALDKTI